MKILRFLIVSLALLLAAGNAQAQFGKRLGKAIENAAKNATVRKAEQKTDEAVSKAIDKATDPDSYGDEDSSKSSSSSKKSSSRDKSTDVEDSEDAALATPKAAEMAYAKSDFVPGDEIFFSDDLANEQMGEFPSQWDLLHGNAEVA
ncbi:MAG: OmpA family protein, partial [Dysgonamonadaceae bacterium]|nr:OmpA family protein [Dysgonamonadaceae bacterium]